MPSSSKTNLPKYFQPLMSHVASHFNTYQGDLIRKSTNDYSNINPSKKNLPSRSKDRNPRRIMTENSEKCLSIGTQMKKVSKQFRLPFKSTSPDLKGKIFETNASVIIHEGFDIKKKSVASKIHTETGPIIKKVRNSGMDRIGVFRKEKNKKINNYLIEKQKKVTQPSNSKQSKNLLTSTKSLQKLKPLNNPTIQGTFDSTPTNLTAFDLEFLALIGQGTFGKVFKAKIIKTGQIVAIKRVFQDPKYKNRQIQIVGLLDCQFTMRVLGTFIASQDGNQYLNIVMEYYDGDLYSYIKNNTSNSRHSLNSFQIKLISYQMLRGLMYIHAKKISHRDIKPHNILLKGKKVVICDFGSAKILFPNEPNLPYICSRCYRAPELIFGATHYAYKIDVWSAGCVMLQMLNGVPLFIGQSSIDHLIEVIKIMGTPTKSQVIDMNPEYDLNDYKFPKIKRKEWTKIFPKSDPLLLDLISKIMVYSPKQRLSAAQALSHEYFDELREQKLNKFLEKQYGLNLFRFSDEQFKANEALMFKLLPEWMY